MYADQWWREEFPEPAVLAPPLADPARLVPVELCPPLAVSAVPVPPPFGVGTLACWPEFPAFVGLPAPVGRWLRPKALPWSVLDGLPVPLPPVEEACAATTPWQYTIVDATLPPFSAMSALKAVDESCGTMMDDTDVEEVFPARKAVQRPN